MQKEANQIGKADFRGRKTNDVGLFLSGPKRKLSYTHIFTSQNSVKIVTKSSLVETKQTFSSIISNSVCESEKWSTTSSPFFPFNTLNLFFFSDALRFLYETISESFYSNFSLILFLWYIDTIYQFFGFYGVQAFVVGPVKWSTMCPRAESLQIETWGLLFPSFAKFFAEGYIVEQLDLRFFILLIS